MHTQSLCVHLYVCWSAYLSVDPGHRAPVVSPPLICSQLATSWTLYCSMLLYHKTHRSSSHHILLCLSLLLSGTWGGRCFSHFSLCSSTTEKAARVQLRLGPDMESLNSLKNERLNGIILVYVPSLFFNVCLWTCEISEATENSITLSLPLNIASLSVRHLPLESIGTENGGGQDCPPPFYLHSQVNSGQGRVLVAM